jgi:hypothetical protein
MLKWLRLIPLAFDVAKTIEAQAPMSGQGKAKLAFAIEVGREIYDIEEDIRKAWGNPDAFLDALSRAVSYAVTLLNATGIFRRG